MKIIYFWEKHEQTQIEPVKFIQNKCVGIYSFNRCISIQDITNSEINPTNQSAEEFCKRSLNLFRWHAKRDRYCKMPEWIPKYAKLLEGIDNAMRLKPIIISKE